MMIKFHASANYLIKIYFLSLQKNVTAPTWRCQCHTQSNIYILHVYSMQNEFDDSLFQMTLTWRSSN